MPGMTFENGLDFWRLILEFITVLIWPITSLFIIIRFSENIRNLLKSVRRAEFPWGGGAVEFEKEVTDLSLQANQPDPEKQARPTSDHPPQIIENYNAALVKRGLEPTASGLDLNYFRRIASDDPNLALAALRIEIETLIKNLATGFGLSGEMRPSLKHSLNSLKLHGAITNLQHSTAIKIIDICNQAIHGHKIDLSTAIIVIDSVQPLLEDYKLWLSWGFPDII